MEDKMLSIIKIMAYQKGIYLPDDLYEELNKSAYDGYRTTSGVFMKFGATMSLQEFNQNPVSKEMSYEDYLKQREWATAQIHKESEMKHHSGESYLKLNYDADGKLVLSGM